jgi:hypothetical protein
LKPLHATFWNKPLGPILHQTVVDSKTFDYVPKDVLDDLNLNLLNFPDALLIFREEYRTALDTLNSWKKPLVRGVVVTGYTGIGAYCNTIRYTQATLLTETSWLSGLQGRHTSHSLFSSSA